MRVLVTGAGGLLGAAIVREFSTSSDHVIALDRAGLDVTDDARVDDTIAAHRPDVVINCAAYNNVDGAEEEPAVALRANAFAVRALARASAAHGAVLVHYSSDFVFDGETDRPYTETDRANPRGIYAASKLLGDLFALEAPAAYVLRVESLFGPAGPHGSRRGSLGTIADKIRAGDEVPVFVDRVVSPSYTPEIAAATRHLIVNRAPAGLYHCVNAGAVTWAVIAERIATLCGLPLRSRPLTLATAGLKAPRPRYCALSNLKLIGTGAVMSSWDEALSVFLRS